MQFFSRDRKRWKERGRKVEESSTRFIASHPKEGRKSGMAVERRRVPRAWGEVKRASSCKGVSFSGSVVARSLPGIQLIVAWRVAPMRAAAAHGTRRRASGGRGPRGSSIDPRPRFHPCHAVPFRACAPTPSPRVRSPRMEARTDRSRKYRARTALLPLDQSSFQCLALTRNSFLPKIQLGK